MARTIRKPIAPKIDRRLVVTAAPAAGEDLNIYECDILHPDNADRLTHGILRLFDPARDDRGPEVPFIATWGNKPSTWHPKTSGVYIVTWTKDAPEAPGGSEVEIDPATLPAPLPDSMVNRTYG